MNFIDEIVRVKQLRAHPITRTRADISFEVRVTHSNNYLRISVDNYCLRHQHHLDNLIIGQNLIFREYNNHNRDICWPNTAAHK